MSQIDELQGRITAAMERISRGLALLEEKTAAAPSEDVAAALEEEKLANAQLEERIRALKQHHEEELAAARAGGSEAERLRAELDTQTDAMARLDSELQRLRLANQQLSQSNAALREANERGVGEPHLINKAMLAELEGLRAARQTETAEAGAILARLQPLLDAAGGEGA